MATVRRLQSRRERPQRRGMSIVEFFGCVSALLGGVAIGAIYLGLEPKQMAVGVLKSAGLLDEQTVDATPEQIATSETPVDTTAGDALTATSGLDGSSAQGPTDPTAASSDPPHVPQAFAGPAAGIANALMTPEDSAPISDDERRQLTETYWEALDQCMRHEVDERLSSIKNSDNWQLFDYLRGRQLGHEAAAKTIAELDARGVNDHVLAYAKRAQKWHEDGGRLFSRAIELLTDAPSGKLSGPFAQSWQSAATQHRMEARLLEEKHGAVQAYLKHERETAESAVTDAATATAAN